MQNESGEKKSKGPRKAVVDLLNRGVSLYYSNLRDSVKTMQLASFSTQRFLEGSVYPAMNAVVDINQQATGSLMQALRGDQEWKALWGETSSRVKAAARFTKLVNTYGKQLFGSARFEGETILCEDEYLRLTYIPPKPGVEEQPFAVFHAGGGLPYGDKLFRLLPEVNFFDRFRERGIGVYAMELRGDRYQVNYSGLTLDKLIDSIEHMSSVAFEHGGNRKMVLEGYCAHGMQALAYVAAKPKEADEKFHLIVTFVSPVDGTDCTMLSEMALLTPERMLNSTMNMWKLMGGYVPGDSMRMSIDLSLRTMFHKTLLGHVQAGWNQPDYAQVKKIEDLSPSQRRDLAGTYWISPDSARRFPITVDLSRFAGELFTKGIGRNGEIPYTYKGTPLSFRTILDQTRLPLIGIFGGKDVMVPDRTAHGLIPLMGKRYTHVVHSQAGHVSYILSPKVWETGNRKGLDPNPIDLIITRVRAMVPAEPAQLEVHEN